MTRGTLLQNRCFLKNLKIHRNKNWRSLKNFSDALAASRKVWENLKKESNNTYSYQLESGIPGWTPNRYQTILEFERGILAAYTVKPIEGTINDEMRKHLPAKKSLDDIYDECESEIVPNLMQNHWFVLDFFSNGVLASCSYNICELTDSEGEGIGIEAFALNRTNNFGPQHSVRSGGLIYECQ